MHSSLITGSMPGIAASTSDTCELGSPPNSVEAPEKSFEREVTWAWTSRPMTTSQSPVVPLISLVGCGLLIAHLSRPSLCAAPALRQENAPTRLWDAATRSSLPHIGTIAGQRRLQARPSGAWEERMITRRQAARFCAAAALAPAFAGHAGAQGASSWPNRFVRLVVPFPPGGGTDVVARILTNRLSEVWGQQMVIENKPGAGSNLGIETVARSDPDGYTILIGSLPFAINRFLYSSLNY